MKRGNEIVWGVILIGVGMLLGLNAFGITRVELFFDGWWTLFIIIPSVTGLLSGNDKGGSMIGLCIGVFLLLCCQDILDFELLWKLVFPVIIILFGIKMIFGSVPARSDVEKIKQMSDSNAQTRYATAVFSGEQVNFSGEVFSGAEFNAVFGGIDILVPDHCNIKVYSNSIFGGVSNKAGNQRNEAAPTLYVKGICMFGGVDIK